jgi:hypothetical protein
VTFRRDLPTCRQSSESVQPERLGVQPQLEPALTIVFLLIVAIGNTVYVQEHLNGVWDKVSLPNEPPSPGASEPPMPPAP